MTKFPFNRCNVLTARYVQIRIYVHHNISNHCDANENSRKRVIYSWWVSAIRNLTFCQIQFYEIYFGKSYYISSTLAYHMLGSQHFNMHPICCECGISLCTRRQQTLHQIASLFIQGLFYWHTTTFVQKWRNDCHQPQLHLLMRRIILNPDMINNSHSVEWFDANENFATINWLYIAIVYTPFAS